MDRIAAIDQMFSMRPASLEARRPAVLRLRHDVVSTVRDAAAAIARSADFPSSAASARRVARLPVGGAVDGARRIHRPGFGTDVALAELGAGAAWVTGSFGFAVILYAIVALPGLLD